MTPVILNTYSTERLGITKGFARYADIVFRLLASKNGLIVFFRIHVLGFILKQLFCIVEKRQSFQHHIFKSISQINIHYRNSMLTFTIAGSTFELGAPKPGDQMPFLDFSFREKINKNTMYWILIVLIYWCLQMI